MYAADYSLFDNMIEGIQVIDHEWKYVYVNNVLAMQGKTTRENLIGRTMMESYPGIEHTQVFNYIAKCMKAGLPYQLLNEFRFPNGTKGWFDLRMHPVPEGVLIMSFDVTKQVLLENELSKTTKMLEKTLQERNSIQEQESDSLRKTFMSMASRELIQPLNTILFNLNEIERNNDSFDPEQCKDQVNQIRRSILHMLYELNSFISSDKQMQGMS
jgi:PAS domain S-box-containing protein